ncbi:hypothetical protein [Candidatus Manganitrophus noduliformans]|uniref:Uncharacterized protein n=1 Tax=Candidatus Manganitrophus noduliformans TaxID=2606439 RepID=A0A7X6DQ29_9BACT|nr:hypothetical protein [Candidatus Manganitrophus noduliformans]NKE71219.1 hypothetical protein [Candidatus Manganitrophus noduliformans]
MKRYILDCREGTPNGPAPKLLSEQGIDRILHRTILGWSPNIGLYGAGGPGFWGFKLAETDQYPEEWLILTVWNAGDCLLIDGEKGEVVAAEFIAMHPDAGVEAFYRHYVARVNEITEKVVGSKIVDAQITPASSEILFQKGGETHRLEIPQGSSEPYQGRSWPSGENQREAWVLSERNELWA